MRKTLLSAALCLVALGAQAQTWTAPATWSKTICSVSDAKELAGVEVALAADGSVITSGTYNQELKFGSTTLANADLMTSAYIAKYNADGTEAWAAYMYGSSIIRSIATDSEGNIYVAGNLADEVVFSSTDGNNQTVKGMADMTAQVTAFIAKYDKDGALKAVKTIMSAADADILASGLYFPAAEDVTFTPTKIQIDGDKLYVSTMYTGDVTIDEMKWEGTYVNVFGFMYMGVASVGIFSLNASDLGGAASIANLQSKEHVTFDVQYTPQSVTFTAANGVVYAGFVSTGEEALTTAKGTVVISAKFPNDGNVEHAYVFTKVKGNETLTRVCHLDANALGYGTDAIDAMLIEGNDLYVGGTFMHQLPFDTIRHATGSGDVFVAKLNAETLETVWSNISGYDEDAAQKNEEAFKHMAINGGKVFVNAVVQNNNEFVKAINYNFAADGTLSTGDEINYAALSNMQGTAIATVVIDGANTNVSLFGQPSSGIEGVVITPATADSKAYNLMGQYVGKAANLNTGLYIINGKKVVIK